jgi:hypothetical protein
VRMILSSAVTPAWSVALLVRGGGRSYFLDHLRAVADLGYQLLLWREGEVVVMSDCSAQILFNSRS